MYRAFAMNFFSVRRVGVILEWTEPLKAITVAVLGGGGVWAFLAAKASAKATLPAAMATSQAQLGDMLNEQTKLLLQESAKDRKDLKRALATQGRTLASQGRQIAVLQQQYAECTIKHQECEERVASLRTEIEAAVALAEKLPPPDHMPPALRRSPG